MSKARLQIGILVSALLSAFVLYLVARDINWEAAREAITRMNFGLVAVGFLMIGLGLIARGLRWHALLLHRLPVRRSLNLTSLAFVINNILPFRAGDIARIEFAAHGVHSVPRATSLSVAVVERLIDLVSLMVLFVLTIMVSGQTVPPEVRQAVTAFGIFTVIGTLAVLALAFVAALREWSRRLVHGLEARITLLERLGVGKLFDNLLNGLAAVNSPRYMGLALWWNFVAWVLSSIAYWALPAALFPNATPADSLLMMVAVAFAISVPVTIASVGAIEGGVVLALGAQGYPPEEALAVGLVLHLCTLLPYALFGLVALWLETLSLATVWSAITGGSNPVPEAGDAV